MSRQLSFVADALLAAATATTSRHGAGRVSIQVAPERSFAPADITVSTILEPSAANRAIEVVVDSGECYRRSAAGLDGGRAAPASQFSFSRLPAGVYQIRVAVKGASGQERGSAIAELRVIDHEAPLR